MAKNKLSVVLATKNEEDNIGSCLESIKDIADEIIVYDEFSEDRTREIAKINTKPISMKRNRRLLIRQQATGFFSSTPMKERLGN